MTKNELDQLYKLLTKFYGVMETNIPKSEMTVDTVITLLKNRAN